MSIRRRLMMTGESFEPSLYAVTKETNPNVMAICYAQGWAANENYMTFEEAAAVTDIGTAFSNKYVRFSFNEFQYFTSVTSVPNSAFNNTYLTSIKFPPNLQSIGMLAFRYAFLREVIIPYSLKTIQANSFQDCMYLTKFIFDNNNTSVANIDWISNTKCNTIEIGDNCTNFQAYDNCLYSANYNTLYRCASYRSSITFHPNITTFGNNALSRVQLTSLIVPSTVTTLPSQFASNSLLVSVDFNNVTKLGDSAFAYSRYASIDFTNTKIKTLTSLEFRGTPITFVRVSTSITSINNTFQDCTRINTIICESTTPPSISSIGRTSIYNNASKNNLHIYVPDAAVDTYKTASVWSTLADYIYPVSDYIPS